MVVPCLYSTIYGPNRRKIHEVLTLYTQHSLTNTKGWLENN